MSSTLERSGQRAGRLGRRACAAALLAMAVGLASGATAAWSACWMAEAPPLFVIKPDPPKEGQDVEVTYVGDSPKDVVFRVGNGKEYPAAIGPDGRFTIPKNILDAGLDLILKDLSLGAKGVFARQIVP